MSSRSTILLTEDKDEHWYFDCDFLSPKGRMDYFIQIDPLNLVAFQFGAAYRKDDFFRFAVVEDTDIFRYLDKTLFKIPLKSIKGIDFDVDCIEIHVCGDCDYFLKSIGLGV